MSRCTNWIIAGLVLAAIIPCHPCHAQQDATVPPLEYGIAFTPLYEGEYATALRVFQAAGRSGVRVGNVRWVDSICYYTMSGECYYNMGRLPKALENYNLALQLAVFHSNWMLRVEFPDQLGPSAGAATARNNITWGRSKRETGLARIPDTMVSMQGNPNNQRVLQQGGVAAPVELYPMNAKEIARCIALAILRRHEIMGPIGEVDSLNNQLIAALSRRPARPNHWSQGWISCQLGLAYAAAGKDQQAIPELTRSLTVAGQFDHELTALGLLGLGRLAVEQGNLQQAGQLFLEASYAAAAFDQYDMVQQAFQDGLVVHLASGQKKMYPPLIASAAWARRYSRALQAWSSLLAAEVAVNLGDANQAAKFLTQARQAAGSREMRNGRFGAYFNYQSALVDFARGNLTAASKEFDTAITFLNASSRRLFQIGLADTMFTKGEVTPRVADGLFEQVLHEPGSRDWVIDPMESLAVTLTPHPLPIQHWFEVVMARKDVPKAIEIADRMKRHRFYSTLPMGGRLLALRWLLEAPESQLSQQAALQRKDLMARHPNYAQLSEQAAGLRQKLLALKVVPQAADQIRQQTELFEQLAQVSSAQELLLQAIALLREPSEFLFPPQKTLKEIQTGLSGRQLMLAFVTTNRYVTVFAISNEQQTSWQVESPVELANGVRELLKQFGLADRRFDLDPAVLYDDSWKGTAGALLLGLTNGADPSMWDAYDELLLVPDGFLWYLPFEALQVARGEQSDALISHVRIRYVPTMGLAVAGTGNRKPQTRTAVVVGQMILGQDRRLTSEAFAGLQAVVPDAERIPDRPPIPSGYYASTIDRLVVLSDLEPNAKTPYGWAPMALDRGKAGSTLGSWMTLPFPSPGIIILPGFHTSAENGMRQNGSGDEVFLGISGLMATGTNTVVLSRWPVGGRSTFSLIREFLQEIPFESAAAAWQRSVLLTQNNPLDPEGEPRLGMTPMRLDAQATHPIFWAGYLVADTGITPGD